MEIKYRYYKDKVIELHKLGYSPIQMEKEIPVESTTLKKWHKRLNLPINKYNKDIHQNVTVTKEEFLEVYNEGLSDLEIGNRLKLSRRGVCKIRAEYGLVKNTESGRRTPVEMLTLDSFGESALIGTMLGDGYMYKKDNKNVKGTLAHSIKQIEYLKHKHKVFENISAVNIDCYEINLKGTIHKAARFNFISNSYLSKFYDNLYENKIKYISDWVIERYDEISLAYHFMDDGSKGNSGYVLCTHGFDLESVKRLTKCLRNKFNLKTTIRKDKAIYIKAESVKKFNKLVSKYIIPSMQYKLHI